MQIPIDTDRFNDNVLGAVRYEPENDFASGQQKMKPGGRAWVIEVGYRDPDDAFGQSEVIKVKYTSPDDPKITFGEIRFGGVRCQSGKSNTKSGEKLWISFSCDSFTQESRPSARRQAAEPAGATA